MMEERYHATTQNRFYPNMSNVNKNITEEAKLISSPTYLLFHLSTCFEHLVLMNWKLGVGGKGRI